MLRVPLCLALAALACSTALHAQDYKHLSLRLDGREVALPASTARRMAGLAQEMMSRCGPNTLLHRDNFGAAAARAEARWKTTDAAASRLHVVYAQPFDTRSLLGGKVPVSEVLIGFDQEGHFVGPDFSRHDRVTVEHMACDYLASLELACLPELRPFMPAAHRDTCARLERGADGRIVLPPPDIAPSCS